MINLNNNFISFASTCKTKRRYDKSVYYRESDNTPFIAQSVRQIGIGTNELEKQTTKLKNTLSTQEIDSLQAHVMNMRVKKTYRDLMDYQSTINKCVKILNKSLEKLSKLQSGFREVAEIPTKEYFKFEEKERLIIDPIVDLIFKQVNEKEEIKDLEIWNNVKTSIKKNDLLDESATINFKLPGYDYSIDLYKDGFEENPNSLDELPKSTQTIKRNLMRLSEILSS